MKKQILIFGAVISSISAVQAQDISQSQVPSVIVNEFNRHFPKATDVEWEMDGNLYKVEFEIGWNIDHEVWYNAAGKWIKHKEDISASELPKAVTDRVKEDFSGYSIDDPERISDNGKIIYKMELNALLQQEWIVIIDSEGNVLSKIAD